MTPAEWAAKADEAADALKAVIDAEVAPANGSNNAKVVKGLLFDRNGEKFADLLRTDTDKDAQGRPRVHTWMLAQVGLSPYDDKTVRSIAWEADFILDGYLSYEAQGDSSQRFTDEVNRILHALANAVNLGVEGVTIIKTSLKETWGLAKMGAQDVHEALGAVKLRFSPIVLG